MKKMSLLVLVGVVALGAMFAANVDSARAVPPFANEFKAMYVKAAPATPAEKSLAEAVATAKCNVCHVGTDKKMRNAYGQALDVLLDKKTDAKDVEKIKKALETVAAQPSKADPKSTYGDLIKSGKLPGG